MTYTAYTKDTPADQVVMLFEAKHGYPPDEVLDAGSIWLAGPIGGKDEADDSP